MTKYSNNIAWIKPFVECAGSVVDLKRLRNVRGYKPVQGKEIRAYGACQWFTRHAFSISILTHEYTTKRHKRVLVPRRFEDILITVAHELAHIETEEHDPFHLLLTSKILNLMAKRALKMGIPDTQSQVIYDPHTR